MLGHSNDPTYAGRPQPTIDAQWFAEFYHQREWGTHHIRRCHYELVSLRVEMPNGKLYENTEDCYEWLGRTTKVARYLHLIPLDALEDRRNDAFVSYVPEWWSPNISVINSTVKDIAIEIPPFPAPVDRPRYGYWYNPLQRYRMEVWIEKSTMNDILNPICRQYEIGFQSAMGEMSLLRIQELVQRIKEDGRPCIIFYISDFDKAGNNMPVAMGVKLNWCLEDAGVKGIQVKIHHIALTEAQVDQFQLPRIPQKETIPETEKFKYGAVELDALEALHPGALRTLITEAIHQYYDTDLINRVWDVKEALMNELAKRRLKVYEDFGFDIRMRLRERERDKIVADVQDRIDEYKNGISTLWHPKH